MEAKRWKSSTQSSKSSSNNKSANGAHYRIWVNNLTKKAYSGDCKTDILGVFNTYILEVYSYTSYL